jgi:hypothetical protein
MKTSLVTLLAAGFLGCATLVGTTGAATAQPLGFSFRIGNVAMGYSDGYYDYGHRWHAWNSRERNWYRSHYRSRYRSMRHDLDRDGIANRFDRDRDNDGVPNYRDRNPNNPYR